MKTSFMKTVLCAALLTGATFLLGVAATSAAATEEVPKPRWGNPSELEECSADGLICASWPGDPPSGAPLYCCIKRVDIGSTDPNACVFPVRNPPRGG